MKKLITFLFIILSANLFSQKFSNLHIKKISFSDSVYLSENYIIVPTIIILNKGLQINDSLYFFNEENKVIVFKKKLSGELTIKYRCLKYDYPYIYSQYDTSIIVPVLENYGQKNPDISKSIDEILSEDGLNKKGFFSRGMTIGTNQDAVVNSKLNLQMNGKITNDLNIEAVITDESIPVQPDGNTAQIQDINKVYIRIFNQKLSITAGDFQAKNPDSYFLKYDKQLKGIEFKAKNYNLNDKIVLKQSQNGLAVSKGKYNRQTITAIEGNQGPYRLQGKSGETYITIVSGSERIFIDGILLERGETNDYIIDYNSAEITFTPNTIVTKDARILAEFEYTERNYTRFSTFTNNYVCTPKFDFFFNVYSQTDAKNQTIDIELTDEMKLLLYDKGDKLDLAIIQNVDSVEFDTEKVLYRQVDTVIDENIYTYYEYSTNPQMAHYQVNFTYVGKNNGNYIIDQNNTNGRIYKWVMPQNGVKQGDYEAQTKIMPPQKSRIFDFGFLIPLTEKQKFAIQYAISDNDLNLFSDFDDNDNIGKALKLNYNYFFKGNDSTKNKSILNFDFEFTDKNFTPLEEYKSPEFKRDLNITEDFSTNEFIGSAEFLKKTKNLLFSINTKFIYYEKFYKGINQNLITKFENHKNFFENNLNYLHSEDRLYKTNFLKSNTTYCRKFGKIYIGGIYKQETNYWKTNTNDSLSQNSFMFHTYGFNISNSDSINKILQINFWRRYDFLPDNQTLKLTNFSNNFSLKSGIVKEKISADFVINYRQLLIKDTTNSPLTPENTISSRLNYRAVFLNQTFSYTSSFEILSGLVQKMQFIYIEVEPGKGVYTWLDYNQDGIKQTDEFEIAAFSDMANYIRVALQSNQYVKVFGKTFVQTLFFSPKNLFNEQSIMYSFASKLNNTFSFSITHKSFDNKLLNFSTENIVNFYYSANNMLNFKMTKNLTVTYLYQKNKIVQLLVNGIESNELKKNKSFLKYKINSQIILDYEFELAEKIVETGYSRFKNYRIKYNGNSIAITYALDKAEANFKYTYIDKLNKTGNEILYENKFSLNTSGVISEKNRISSEISLVNNIFRGDANTTVAYSMLEGLKPDLNILWTINYVRNIGKSLRLTFLYSGRYSPSTKIINTGSVNITAFF